MGLSALFEQNGITDLTARKTPPSSALPTGATLAQQAGAVMEAATRGDISLGQAAQLVGAVAALAKIIETDELQRRIEALEAHHARKT